MTVSSEKTLKGIAMGFVFDIERTVQIVGHLFHEAQVDRINVMKMLKLLYIADRESLRDAGYPVTGDQAVAMEHGPVLSRIYDLSKTTDDWELNDEERAWRNFFRRVGHDLVLERQPTEEKLSDHDAEMIDLAIARYGQCDQFQLRDLTHDFPEWRNNEIGHSSRPIPLHDILEAVGRLDEAKAIEQDQREAQFFAHLFGG